MYLCLENLTKKYGENTVVNGLNVDVEKGELISLLGPSGCGKTTTLNMIGGFARPDEGRILLEDRDITGTPPQLRPVSTVFQSYALFPHMTVLGNVIYGLKFRKGFTSKRAKARGREMLEAVGLHGNEDKTVTSLSGGQQQRVALARSLVLNPKLLLMDEPLSNLDAKLRVRMRLEIQRIQREFNITMIFVTHDQEEAMSISDRIMVMHNGTVDQAGAPEDLYQNPRTPFIAGFIGRINQLPMNGGTVYVRPEHLSIRKATEDAPSDLQGVVRNRSFLGSRVSYSVDTPLGEVQVDVTNAENGNACSVGETVSLCVERETRLELQR